MNRQIHPRMPGYHYAGFWSRVFADIVDSIVLIPAALLSFAFDEPTYWYVNAAVFILYKSLLESSEWQATMGKKLLGLKVTDKNLNRISFPLAVLRSVLVAISFTFPLLFIVVALSEKKRGLHDMICGTLVFCKEGSEKNIKMEVNYNSRG